MINTTPLFDQFVEDYQFFGLMKRPDIFGIKGRYFKDDIPLSIVATEATNPDTFEQEFFPKFLHLTPDLMEKLGIEIKNDSNVLIHTAAPLDDTSQEETALLDTWVQTTETEACTLFVDCILEELEESLRDGMVYDLKFFIVDLGHVETSFNTCINLLSKSPVKMVIICPESMKDRLELTNPAEVHWVNLEVYANNPTTDFSAIPFFDLALICTDPLCNEESFFEKSSYANLEPLRKELLIKANTDKFSPSIQR
jgi:hypothetical protein